MTEIHERKSHFANYNVQWKFTNDVKNKMWQQIMRGFHERQAKMDLFPFLHSRKRQITTGILTNPILVHSDALQFVF